MKKISLFLALQIIIGSIFAADDALFTGMDDVDNGFAITVVNVGQGNGIRVIDNTKGHTLLVDAGSSKYPEGQTIASMTETLTTHLPQKLSLVPITIVVSHPDKDHLNLFKKILETPLLKSNKSITVFLGGSFEKYLTSSEAKDLLDVLIKLEDSDAPKQKTYSLSHALSGSDMKELCDESVKIREKFSGEGYHGYENLSSAIAQTLESRIASKVRPFILGSVVENVFDDTSRAKVEIMCANAGHTPTRLYPFNSAAATILSFVDDSSCVGAEVVNPDENTNSIVLRIYFYESTTLAITGDATGITTDRLIKNYSSTTTNRNLECDIVIACHHGSITEESNNARWVDATLPKYVVFSAGKHNGYHHPQFDAVWNYASSKRLCETKKHPLLCARVDNRELPRKEEAEKREIVSPELARTGDKDKQQWLDVETTRGIYSTNSSGTISINVKSDRSIEFLTAK